MDVSVCIPAFNRPKLLGLALDSVEKQRGVKLEILIGDDSDNDESLNVIKSRKIANLRYFRHKPNLGQASNVNFLFDKAIGKSILLLHDDDELEEDAIEKMFSCFSYDVDVVFGKQRIISVDGKINYDASDELNCKYFRTASRKGRQKSAVESALLAQFPNDGFLVETNLAKSTKLRADKSIGPACDYFFGIDLSKKTKGFFFLDQFTARYRVGNDSILTSQRYDENIFLNLLHVDVPICQRELKNNILKAYFLPAFSSCLINRKNCELKTLKKLRKYYDINPSLKSKLLYALSFLPLGVSSKVASLMRKAR
jgi:glycosyltransferase involved in cell wall biosynthesis